MNTKIAYFIFLFLAAHTVCAQEYQQSADHFIAKNPDKIFIGAILASADINSDMHLPWDVSLNPITISYSIPIKSQEIIPSYNNMIKAVQEKLQQDDKLLQQNYQFSYSISELESYEELAVFFGQNINPSLLFGIANQELKKKIIVLEISQIFFSINMDQPGSLSDDPKVFEQRDKLIYINSISFGRKAILTIESTSSYQEVKEAIEDILKNIGDNEAGILDKSKTIIANATLRCMTIGDNTEEIDSNNPLGSMANYFNKKVTIKDFGTPISFSAAYLKDNSMFVNKFTIRQ